MTRAPNFLSLRALARRYQVVNVHSRGSHQPYGTVRGTPSTNAPVDDHYKALLRPDLSLQEWRRDGLCDRPWPPPLHQATHCERLSLAQASMKLDFATPAIIEGVISEWPRPDAWTLANLLQQHGDTEFVVGMSSSPQVHGSELGHSGNDTDDGITECYVKMTLQDYVSYTDRQQDDSPMYIFDDGFLESDCELASTYSRPAPLAYDFMDLLRGTDRLPYRGFLVGAARCGTVLHVDALQTSAWNTLVSGAKRWIMFPPCATMYELMPGFHVYGSAAHWLHLQYPDLQWRGPCFDFVQLPGDTVYVPRGWWHNVVNLSFSVAVTENFVSRRDLHAALEHLQGPMQRPELVRRWLAALRGDARCRRNSKDGAL